MLKKLLIVTLGVTSVSPFAATSAMATVATPIADMSAVCAATQVSPAPNSTYQVTLNLSSITSVVGAEVETGRVTLLNEPGGVLLSSAGPTYVAGTQGRNGQSPNIFGTFQTVKTYSGAHLIQEVSYRTDTTFTYGCTVSKIQTNPRTGAQTVTTPPGLQIEGLQMTRSETRTETIDSTTPPVTVTDLSEMVICNSPLKNPGVWRNQNGYTGVCSTTLFNSLSQIAIHSASLPPIEPIDAPADFSSDSFNNDSGPASVTDTEIGEDETAS